MLSAVFKNIWNFLNLFALESNAKNDFNETYKGRRAQSRHQELKIQGAWRIFASRHFSMNFAGAEVSTIFYKSVSGILLVILFSVAISKSKKQICY